MKKLTLVLVFSFIVAGLSAQHDHANQSAQGASDGMPMFKDAKVGMAYTDYLALKDALVASNVENAKNAAGKLKTSLAGIKGSEKALKQATKINAGTNLDDARFVFAELSTEMSSLVKGSQLAGGALYLEYCPMANNNAGAYWLSNEKEIKNPYFGSKMLKCGSVKETIQ